LIESERRLLVLKEMNHYQLLGLAKGASDAEVRGAFKRLARKYHPDKRASALEHLSNPQTYDEHSEALAGTGAANFDEMFSLLANAYNVLGDPAKRAAYDLELMCDKKTNLHFLKETMKKLRELRRHDALLQSDLMAVTCEQRKEAEQKRGGLVIVEALYGAAIALDSPEKHPNEVVDVSRQLQTLVESSKLVLPKGESKTVSIPGVFDPCPENSNKNLRVRYTFKGKLHEVIVGNEDMLMAPMKSHLLATRGTESVVPEYIKSRELHIQLQPGSGQMVSFRKNESRTKLSGSQVLLSQSIRVVAIIGLAVEVLNIILGSKSMKESTE